MAIGILASLEGEAKDTFSLIYILEGNCGIGFYLASFLLAGKKKKKKHYHLRRVFSSLKD